MTDKVHQATASTTNIAGEEDTQDNDNETYSPSSSEQQPLPLFKIRQRVLARDTDTPLLYDAIVRKTIYAPKSKKVHICRVDLNNHDSETIDGDNDDSLEHAWHYFVHYQGWNVNWDRWVEEGNLFEDKESTRLLAKKLKQESKCLKRKTSDKVVMEVMQRMLKLEQEFREKEARGESVEYLENETVNKMEEKVEVMGGGESKNKIDREKTIETKKSVDDNIVLGKSKKAKQFIQKELKLRQKDLSSKKPSNAINLPFTIKKVLTDEWEIISQCGMVHKVPSSVTVKDVLDAYYKGKIKMLRNDPSTTTTTTMTTEEHDQSEEKKDDTMHSSIQNAESMNEDENTTMEAQNPAEQEWKDMADGLAMYFDKSLPKQLLYRQELPQCNVVEGLHLNKRYCELYPCEHLVRLCLKLPELVDQTDYLGSEDKAKIIFKLGDFVRFIQKHQGTYLLSRYRHQTTEERLKAKKMQSRLGLGRDEHKNSGNVANVETPKTNEEDENMSQFKRKRNDEGGGRKRRRKA